MREKKLNIICISAIIGLFCLSFVSCKDSYFDLSNIDKTLGFGSDSISVLGSSSTDSIKLSDILKLYDSNFVTILDNGDYSFVKSNDNITPAHPYVDQVSVGGMGSKSLDVNCFSESASAKRYYAKATALSAITRFSDKMEIFGFETEHIPSEIKELNKAYIKSTINVTVTYSDEIVKNISKFQTVVITLPAYLKIGKATYNGTTVTPNANNQIVLNNVETSAKKFTMQFALDALDFDATENIVKSNELTFLQGKKIIMNGYVQVSGTFDASELDPSLDKSKCNIHCDVNYGDITLTGATGKFSPSLTFANFETVNLENIPNFLKDHDVNIDLYNPQVVIKATSDLPLKGIVSGTLTSTFADGSTPVTIEVPQFSINANGTSNICICKNASAITNTYDHQLAKNGRHFRRGDKVAAAAGHAAQLDAVVGVVAQAGGVQGQVHEAVKAQPAARLGDVVLDVGGQGAGYTLRLCGAVGHGRIVSCLFMKSEHIRCVLVTGAGRRLGRHIALELACAGG